MTISSPGIGSGLDVQSIVSKLVALEKAPLGPLQQKASGLSSKLSAYGQLKSQIATLQDQAGKLAEATNWQQKKVTSSDASVTGTATAAAASAAFTLEVSQLARAQSVNSGLIPSGSPVGEGALKIQIGTWSGGAFAAGAASEVSIDITAADDTLAKVAAKINGANAGVTATVLRDASGERLLMRSSTTGEASGFRIQTADSDGDNLDNAGLSRLAFDPESGSNGLQLTQSAQDTEATINGVAVRSATTIFAGTIDGLTFKVGAVTTGPVEISIDADTESAKKSVSDFVNAYNGLSIALGEMTRYNPDSKTAGTLQGDSTAVQLQSAMRQLLGSLGPAGGEILRLTDIGVQFQSNGTLKVDDTKLSAALAKPAQLQAFFAADPAGTEQDGLATRIKAFTTGLLGVDGVFETKTASIQSAVKRNTQDQDLVNERASRTEVRLLAQYSRLDTQLAGLNALNSYISQQVTTWNKSKN